MAELDGNSSSITVDTDDLQYVSADYNDERQISEAAPDTATQGKTSADPGIYQTTLSLTGNTNIAAGEWFGEGIGNLEIAFNAGTEVALVIEVDEGDANYQDVGNFRIYSFKKGLKVGEIQQWSAELKSNGNVTRTRPSA